MSRQQLPFEILSPVRPPLYSRIARAAFRHSATAAGVVIGFVIGVTLFQVGRFLLEVLK